MLAAANHRVNCVQILLQEGAEPHLKAKVRPLFVDRGNASLAVIDFKLIFLTTYDLETLESL